MPFHALRIAYPASACTSATMRQRLLFHSLEASGWRAGFALLFATGYLRGLMRTVDLSP